MSVTVFPPVADVLLVAVGLLIVSFWIVVLVMSRMSKLQPAKASRPTGANREEARDAIVVLNVSLTVQPQGDSKYGAACQRPLS